MILSWVMAASIAITSGIAYVAIPKQKAVTVALQSDSVAVNLIAYQKSVQRYFMANPSSTGVISDAMITSSGAWQLAYIRNPEWTNIISGGQLFVYSTGSASESAKSAMATISRRGQNKSALIGSKNATTGRLVNSRGVDTGVNLPAAIPNGAIVLMGR